MTATSVAADELAVATSGLTKRYRRRTAVAALDLHVPAGSVYGLIGVNGAGKSTTFAMLAGLLRPSGGAATVAGIDIARSRDVRRVVGYMPDVVGVYDDLRVGEYLDFFAGAYDVPASRRPALVDGLLELVELTDHRHEMVDGLSRGMKQRLSMARTLVHDPEVLLLDEPASGLDPRSRRELWSFVATLRDLGKTVVVASHILPELAAGCDHVGVLHEGRLVAQGRPSELRRGAGVHRRLEVRFGDGTVEHHDVADDADQRAVLARLVAEDPRGVLEARAAGAELEDLFLDLADHPPSATVGVDGPDGGSAR